MITIHYTYTVYQDSITSTGGNYTVSSTISTKFSSTGTVGKNYIEGPMGTDCHNEEYLIQCFGGECPPRKFKEEKPEPIKKIYRISKQNRVIHKSTCRIRDSPGHNRR